MLISDMFSKGLLWIFPRAHCLASSVATLPGSWRMVPLLVILQIFFCSFPDTTVAVESCHGGMSIPCQGGLPSNNLIVSTVMPLPFGRRFCCCCCTLLWNCHWRFEQPFKIVCYGCSSFGCGGHNSFNTLVLSSQVITYYSSLLQMCYDICHSILKCRLRFFGPHKVVYSIKHNHNTEIRNIKACVIQIRK